ANDFGQWGKTPPPPPDMAHGGAMDLSHDDAATSRDLAGNGDAGADAGDAGGGGAGGGGGVVAPGGGCSVVGGGVPTGSLAGLLLLSTAFLCMRFARRNRL